MEYDQEMVDGIHANTIINMDPPQHQKVRRIVRNAFTPKRVESYAAKFREHAKRIVDAVASRGECEFVEEVAAELPLIAILELLGVPLEDRKKVLRLDQYHDLRRRPGYVYLGGGGADGITGSHPVRHAARGEAPGGRRWTTSPGLCWTQNWTAKPSRMTCLAGCLFLFW